VFYYNYAVNLLRSLILLALPFGTTQIKEFRSANLSMANDLKLVDIRGVLRENPLYSDTAGDFANGERFRKHRHRAFESRYLGISEFFLFRLL